MNVLSRKGMTNTILKIEQKMPPTTQKEDEDSNLGFQEESLKSMLDWRNGIGYLTGTPFKFFQNEFGIIELMNCPEEDTLEDLNGGEKNFPNGQIQSTQDASFDGFNGLAKSSDSRDGSPELSSSSECSCKENQYAYMGLPSAHSCQRNRNDVRKKPKNKNIESCNNCGFFGLREEFLKGKFCTNACQFSYNLRKNDNKEISREKFKVPILNGKSKKSKTTEHNEISAGGQNKSSIGTFSKQEEGGSSINTKLDNSMNGKVKLRSRDGRKAANHRICSNKRSSRKPIGKRNANPISISLKSKAVAQGRQSKKRSKIMQSPLRKAKKLLNSTGRRKTKLILTKHISKQNVSKPKRKAEISSSRSSVTSSSSNDLKRKEKSITPRKRNFRDVLNNRVLGRSDDSSNKASADSFSKGEVEFDWQKYLLGSKAKAAPLKLFKQPPFPPPNPFKPNMALEAIDPQHQNLFCAVKVTDIQGYRLRLRFLGFSEVYDFWVNADSYEIFPCGWAEKNGFELHAPTDAEKCFTWRQYLKQSDLVPAPNSCFAILKEELLPSEVEVGMKLEAIDLRNENYHNLMCVATVAAVIGDRFLVHFDSWDSKYDYWVDATSPFIRPSGWCQRNDMPLLPPAHYEKEFQWSSYLKETKSITMPEKLFRPLPPVGFKAGIKLECVDKRNPFIVRVATVSEVKEHFITIHFDNFSEIYDYTIYELSQDIHPVGWCKATGHHLQVPPPQTEIWKGPCPTFGCYGLGHVKGPRYLTHNSESFCPYAIHNNNYKKELALADRITLLERNLGLPGTERLPVIKPSRKKSRTREFGRKKRKLSKGGMKKIEDSIDSTESDETTSNDSQDTCPEVFENRVNNGDDEVKAEATPPMSETLVSTKAKKCLSVVRKPAAKSIKQLIEDASLALPTSPDQSVSPDRLNAQIIAEKNQKIIEDLKLDARDILKRMKNLVGDCSPKKVKKWSDQDVYDFICRIPGCKKSAEVIKEHNLDGDSFLMLTRKDFISVMKLKMGPALKLSYVLKVISDNRIHDKLS